MIQWLAVLALIVIFAMQVGAVCSEPQPRLVCAEYFQSEVVVEAKLLHTKHITPDNDQDYFLYEMEADKILRGNVGQEFQIWEENSSGRATFDWKPGRSYLLFLFPAAGKKDALELDGCGNSGPLSKAATALKQIDAIPGARDGMIQVVVGLNRTADSGRSAHIKLSSAKKSFQTTTNKQGVAEIHVPPGEYKIDISGKEKFWLFDLSYENPENVVIEKGSCAQIQYF